jgi:hypothetical protein
MRNKMRVLAIATGLALTLLSTGMAGKARATYSEIMGCETGCEVAAAGWPVPFLVDYPGLSVTGAANLLGALAGEDHFRLLPFCLSLLFWIAVAALGVILFRRVVGNRGDEQP